MSAVSISDQAIACEVFHLAKQDNAHFAAQVCARAFEGDHMFETTKGELLLHIEETLKELRAKHDLPRTAQHYYDQWKSGTGNSTPWFRTSLNETGTEMVHMTAAANLYLEILGRSKLNVSATTVDKLGPSFDFFFRSAAQLSGRVEEQQAIIQEQIQKLQEEWDTLERLGAGALDDRDLVTMATKAREIIIDIRAGVSAAPAAARQMNRDINEALYSPETEGAKQSDLHGRALDIHSEFSESHPHQILKALSRTYGAEGKREALHNAIAEVTENLKDHLSFEDRQRINSFFSYAINISRDMIAEHQKTSRQLLNFVEDPEINERKREAIEFKETRKVCMLIGRHLKPTPRDSRLKDIGLEYPDRDEVPHPAPVTSRLSPWQQPTTTVSATVEPDYTDFEQMKREGEAAIKLGKRRARTLASSTFKRKAAVLLEEQEEITVAEFFASYPLSFGLMEFEAFFSFAATKHPSTFDVLDVTGIPLRDGERLRQIIVPNFRLLRTGEPGMSYGAAAHHMTKLQTSAAASDLEDDIIIDLSEEDFTIAAQ